MEKSCKNIRQQSGCGGGVQLLAVRHHAAGFRLAVHLPETVDGSLLARKRHSHLCGSECKQQVFRVQPYVYAQRMERLRHSRRNGGLELLKAKFNQARQISGLDSPNLIVYGGGREIHEYCMEYSLLYVTDFMSEKGDRDNG